MRIDQDSSFSKRNPALLKYGIPALVGMALIFLILATISIFSPSELEVQLNASGIETLELKISSGNHAKLAAKRNEALRRGFLIVEDADMVEGKLVWKGEEIPVKLRLKGDWTDHLKGEKWSYRVECANGFAWNGMTTFSLQAPERRDFLNEWVFHQLMEQEDILTTRYDFIHLKINGSSKGIFAWEEHFTKQLVESRKRREGPILKFSEDGLWNMRFAETTGITGIPNQALIKYASSVEAFSPGKTLKDPRLNEAFTLGRNLLWLLQFEKVPLEEIMDVQRWAGFLAMSDLARTYHGIAWHNLRFYYNPVSGLLEPVGFDGSVEGGFKEYMKLPPRGERGLQGFLFGVEPSDRLSMTRRAYKENLQTLTRNAYLDSFFGQVDKRLQQRILWLQLEYPEYVYQPANLYESAAKIREYFGWKTEEGQAE